MKLSLVTLLWTAGITAVFASPERDLAPRSFDEFMEWASGPITSRDHDNRIYFAAEIKDFDPHSHQEKYSHWSYEQPVGTLSDVYLFSIAKDHPLAYQFDDSPFLSHGHHAYKREILELDPNLKFLELQKPRMLYKKIPLPYKYFPELEGRNDPPVDSAFKVVLDAQDKFDIHDPGFIKQWHLINPMQVGNDLNVTGVWDQNITGKSVAVAVVDDGIDMHHEDLAPNYFAEGSWDFNDNGPEPSPKLADDRHGTRCCGEISAARNDQCGVGVAYDSKIAGIRILSSAVSESDEAISLNYAMDKNDIYSCSWGPMDDGKTMEAPGMLVKKAFLNGVQNGRDKKGSLFVFASGNGAHYGDNCNFDGYTNSIYSITVAAIDRFNNHPYYSEACSANMVVTYSSGAKDHIYTTDVGHTCTNEHGGTSAAAPIAAGIFALVLDVRPDLTWRDMQYLAWDSAVPFNEDAEGWQSTPTGKKFHHQFGFGKLDAFHIVERAKTWELVKPQAWFFSEAQVLNESFEYSADTENGGITSVITVTKEQLSKSNFERLEHVNVKMNLIHKYRGAVTVHLESPSGVISELTAPRPLDRSTAGYQDWKFMSVVHWNEEATGDWKLHVFNADKEDFNGTFVDWSLMLWGECEDPSKAELFSYDSKPADNNEPKESSSSAEVIQSSATVSSGIHETTSTSVVATVTSSSATSATSKPDTTVGTEAPTAEPSGSKEYDAFLPSFGMSSRTSTWVYGSLLLIIIFVIGVCGYIFFYKKKMGLGRFSRISPSNEFELVPSHGDDSDDEFGGETLHDEDMFTERSSDDLDDTGVSPEVRQKRQEFYKRSGLPVSGQSTGDENSPAGSTIGQLARSLYDNKSNQKTTQNQPESDSDVVLFAVESDED